MTGLSFKMLMSLLETDFFDIDQIKAIKYGLEHKKQPVMKLTDEQLKQLDRMEVIDP